MDRKIIRILIGISITALAIRLAAGIDLYKSDPFSFAPPVVTDMATYISNAMQIMKFSYHDLFYYQPFYYAVFMPLTMLIAGGSLIGTVIAQGLLSAATVYLAGLTSLRIFGKKAAIITAILLAFNNVLTVYTAYCLIATLQAFWVILILYLAVRAIEKSSLKIWITLGLVTGLSILTRGNVWFFVPGLACLALYLGIKNKKKRFNYIVFFLVFLMIPQLPFSIWNSVKLGKLSGPSTAGPTVLALGNTPEAPPSGKDPGSFGPGPMEYPLSFQVWMDNMDKISVPHRILNWFMEEPGAYSELNFRKLLLFWDWREVPNNIEIKYNCSKSIVYEYLPLIPNYFVIFSGLAAFLAFFFRAVDKRNAKLRTLLYFIAAYMFATMAFYILGRFRLPVVPLLAVASGGFFYFFFKAFLKKKRVIFYVFFGVFIASAFVSFMGFDLYRGLFEKSVVRHVRPNGVRVELSPNESIYMDNGPATCGGWTPRMLFPGTVISKRFMIKEKGPFAKATIQLKIYWEDESFAEFETNGMAFTVKSGNPGLREHEIPVHVDEDGYVRLRVKNLGQGRVFVFFDSQRDYERTAIDGFAVPAELVGSLKITTK